MRLTVQEIRRHHFNRKVRGYDPVEVEAFLELVAQEMEVAFRELNESRVKIQAYDKELNDYKVREKTLQDALKHAQETAEQITESARRNAELQLKEAQVEIERAKQKGVADLRTIQEETIKLEVQKESFLRRLRYMLQAEEELLEILSNNGNVDSTHSEQKTSSK